MEVSLAIAVGLAVAGALALETGFTSALLDVLAGVVLALILPSLGEVDWMHFLAHLGMLSLMFMAGFEVQTDRLRRERRACLGVGAASLAVPCVGIGASRIGVSVCRRWRVAWSRSGFRRPRSRSSTSHSRKWAFSAAAPARPFSAPPRSPIC